MSPAATARMRPTMADVAERAGVSKMTVSRVVNGRPGVSAASARRVNEAIRTLNYVLSYRGRSLAVGSTHLIGMIVLDVVSEWVWPLITGAGREAEQQGYQLLLRTTGGGEVGSLDVQPPSPGGDLLDGMIIVSWRIPLTFARQLARRHFPVVLVDAYQRPRRISWVSCEDRRGAREAALHLAALGHRRIAFIGGGEDPYLARERLLGFRDGLAEAGLRGRETRVVQGDFTRQSGYRQALRLLGKGSRPTAIFAANDLMAIGVLDAAKEVGVGVPADLSVVGFDGIASGEHVTPTLSTVRRPYDEMGATAVRLLVEAIGIPEQDRAVRQVDLPTSLIARESTAAPTQRAMKEVSGNTKRRPARAVAST